MRPDGSFEQLIPADGKKIVYKDIREAVGGYLEHILVNPPLYFAALEETYTDAYLDEDGKLRKLQTNIFATSMVRGIVEYGDILVGNVVFLTKEEFKASSS